MKRLPDRYYDLVMERDQLLEEADYVVNHTPIDVLEYLDLKSSIDKLNGEIELIEKEMSENRKFYIIAREVYDIENESYYSFVNEYQTVVEALVEFKIQKDELKELFLDYKELDETEDRFYISDDVEVVELCLYEINID